MLEKSASAALLACKCPRCHVGNVFASPLSTKWFSRQMNLSCSVCNLIYEREPGFFYGAMYVSYGFSMAIAVAIGMILYVFMKAPPVHIYMGIVVGIIGLLWPPMFRYSRVIFLYMFGGITYDEKYRK